MGHGAPRSPLAPAAFPDLPAIAGLTLGVAEAGTRYRGRLDAMLAVLPEGSAVAGVLTRSATASADVLGCREVLARGGTGRAAIVVTAGNANAFTGRAGDASVAAIRAGVAAAAGVDEGRVLTCATGVIGEPLPHDRVLAVLDALAAGGASWAQAADAIRTTDTFPKGAGARVGDAAIAGIAKGSGMIAPDMATMLAYVFTDAAIPPDRLQAMLSRQADLTFNRITVDSDTSTSDTLLLAATGAAGPVDEAAFEAALHGVLLDLAHQVVRDGEGASKFVTVRVTGAQTGADAERVARAIADSPLVKTAVAGEDPNWGRVVMAVGKSGAKADRDRLSIRFGDVLVAAEGWVHPDYREADAAAHMKGPEVTIHADLGLGAGEATVWTCDLTHGYIDINADYRS
ncbi:MAG: bifunctional glutamate N-acetyltransferase/amino-acid acetyltransferase ArgJ [Hasllibacter sp.]